MADFSYAVRAVLSDFNWHPQRRVETGEWEQFWLLEGLLFMMQRDGSLPSLVAFRCKFRGLV